MNATPSLQNNEGNLPQNLENNGHHVKILATQENLANLPTPPNDGTTLIMPLGGCGMIGMNATLYGRMGRNGPEWILVDCGIGLGVEDEIHGLDAMTPDPIVLEKLGKQLKACIITHGHEDHIGALTLFWPTLKCPIIAPNYPYHILDERFKRKRVRHNVHLMAYTPGEPIRVEGFKIHTIPMTHSIPDSVLLSIQSKDGLIIHSGDWKLDTECVVGRGTSFKLLEQLGNKHVHALVGESTNAEREGYAGSERDVAIEMKKICEETSGMVVAAGFASNMGRVVNLQKIAAQTGRVIAVAGTSMYKNLAAAEKCGYIANKDDFLHVNDLVDLPKNRIILLVTGAQGEENAALRKLVDKKFPIELDPGDSVCFNARVIPGNEEAVEAVKTDIKMSGATLITPEDRLIHVSGHENKQGHIDFIKMLRPDYVIPVHGDKQRDAHAQLAQEIGFKACLLPEDGTVAAITKDGVHAVGKIPVKIWGSDGDRVMPAGPEDEFRVKAYLQRKEQTHGMPQRRHNPYRVERTPSYNRREVIQKQETPKREIPQTPTPKPQEKIEILYNSHASEQTAPATRRPPENRHVHKPQQESPLKTPVQPTVQKTVACPEKKPENEFLKIFGNSAKINPKIQKHQNRNTPDTSNIMRQTRRQKWAER